MITRSGNRNDSPNPNLDSKLVTVSSIHTDNTLNVNPGTSIPEVQLRNQIKSSLDSLTDKSDNDGNRNTINNNNRNVLRTVVEIDSTIQEDLEHDTIIKDQDMTSSISSVKSDTMRTYSQSIQNNNGNLRQGPISAPNTPEAMRKQHLLLRHRADLTATAMIRSHPPPAAKKEKMEFNQMMMKISNEKDGRPLSFHGRPSDVNSSSMLNLSPVSKRHVGGTGNGRSRKESALFNRRSMPTPYLENRFRDKFDISDLDTNLPRIDLEAIENHLRLAREEEKKRRSDRDEIRRRLALESEELGDKPGGRKPSLHSRLQSSMNLQICFINLNETASDSESPGSDTEAQNSQQPASLPCIKAQSGSATVSKTVSATDPSEDFCTKQMRLQAEARHALSQAKEMARLQMTQEKERRLQSPITEMVRNSLRKVGMSLPPERRRVSRQLLTEMNVTQLQVIVNDLHTHIEVLNETLVSMLLERDDLHMEQDSMLVDIEDLTRYLAAKDNSPHQSLPLITPGKSILGKK